MLKSDYRELRNSKVKFKWVGGGWWWYEGIAETRLDLVNILEPSLHPSETEASEL